MTGTTARPTGITVRAILAAFNGVLSLRAAIGFIAGAPLIASIIPLAVAILIIWYPSTKSVRSAFGRA